FDGWLDNKPADNPVTGGVLALTSATGPVNMAGGLISGGTITTTGTGILNVIPPSGPFYYFASYLDSVTNAGTITMSDFLGLEGNVVNNGTVNSHTFLFSLPGGSFTNNGSINLTSFAFAGLQSPVINNGTITLNQSQFSVFVPAPAVALTNNGSIFVSSGGG